MRRETDAAAIFARLLDRHERSGGGRRIIERPSQSFAEPEGLRSLVERLSAAADFGAVRLVPDRDAPHLISEVVLEDPQRLYAFTGRTPACERAAAAAASLAAINASSEPARALVRDLADAWGRGAKLIGLGTEDLKEATGLVAAIDAAFAELPPSVPLRTRSARLLGDSKALEKALPSMLAYMRQVGIVDPELGREEALARLGLSKFAQPVLVSGPLVVGGARIDAWPYAGVPPELVDKTQPAAEIRSLLTIENLESFNRHVRTNRRPGDVVIYTGGFPSGSVLASIRGIMSAARTGCLHHWGDVDPGGVRIGRHLETALQLPVVPHLMDAELARRRGRAPATTQSVPKLPRESAFSELADYLLLPDARWLEQEVVDPCEVGRAVQTAPAPACSNMQGFD